MDPQDPSNPRDETSEEEIVDETRPNRPIIASNNDPCTSISSTPMPPTPENAYVYQRPMYGRRNFFCATMARARVAEVGTSTGAPAKNKQKKSGNPSGSATSKGAATVKAKNPMKAMEVTTSRVPLSKPNSEPCRGFSSRTRRVAAGITDEPDQKAMPSSTAYAKASEAPNTGGPLRGKSINGISCKNISSLGGDLSGHRNANDRVSHNNKIKVFDGQLLRLERVQADFLRKLEALKGMADKNREFKLIEMMPTEDNKPIVNASHTVNDFKNGIHDVLHGCLATMQEYIKNIGGLEIAHIKDKLEQEQTHRVSLLLDKMKELCSATDASQQDTAKYEKEILDDKRVADDRELKKAHASQMIKGAEALKTELDPEISKREITIGDQNRMIDVLGNGEEILKQTVESTKSADTVEQEKRARLDTEINSLKDFRCEVCSQLTLTKELKDKNDEIAKLQTELEETKKLFDVLLSVHSRTKSELSHQFNEKAKELTQLRAAYEQTKKDYAILEQTLMAARKELKDIHDCRAEVEKYKAEIKKLKQHPAEVHSKRAALSTHEHKIKLMEEHINRIDIVRAQQKEQIISLQNEVDALKRVM